jgi:hypothetical protein
MSEADAPVSKQGVQLDEQFLLFLGEAPASPSPKTAT